MNTFKAAAVGAFVIAGILLFGVGLFLIGDRRMLFSDTFERMMRMEDSTTEAVDARPTPAVPESVVKPR